MAIMNEVKSGVSLTHPQATPKWVFLAIIGVAILAFVAGIGISAAGWLKTKAAAVIPSVSNVSTVSNVGTSATGQWDY